MYIILGTPLTHLPTAHLKISKHHQISSWKIISVNHFKTSVQVASPLEFPTSLLLSERFCRSPASLSPQQARPASPSLLPALHPASHQLSSHHNTLCHPPKSFNSSTHNIGLGYRYNTLHGKKHFLCQCYDTLLPCKKDPQCCYEAFRSLGFTLTDCS